MFPAELNPVLHCWRVLRPLHPRLRRHILQKGESWPGALIRHHTIIPRLTWTPASLRPRGGRRRQRGGRGWEDTLTPGTRWSVIRVLKPILSQSRGRYVLKSDTLTQTCVKLVALMPPQCVKVARPTLAISTRPQLVNIRYFSLSESRDVWLG